MLLECHCTRCRQWTGASSFSVVAAPAAGFEITAGADKLKSYAPEGFTPRNFCSECGSSVYSGGGDTRYVAAGLLDEVPLDVAAHIQVADKAGWHEIGGEAPQYATFPG
jgi:hypothetical protein